MADLILSSLEAIVHIVQEIKKAVETVQQNQEECRNMARDVEINSGILQRLMRRTGICNDKLMHDALEDVKTSFLGVLDLVRKCQQDQHTVRRLFSASDIANELDRKQHEIDRKIHQACLCGITHGNILMWSLYNKFTTPPPAGEDSIIHDALTTALPQRLPPVEEEATAHPLPPSPPGEDTTDDTGGRGLINLVATIVNIALQIKEAVETVRQNEHECHQIARCVDRSSSILQILAKETDITKVEVMRHALEDAKTTFEDALKLVKKCQKRHIFRCFFSAMDMANDLEMVLRNMGLMMQQASLCGIVHNASKIHNAAATIAPSQPSPPPPPPPGEEDIEGFTRFRISVLMNATNNFSDQRKIGEGNFGSMYKGKLHGGREVTIKKFDEQCIFQYEMLVNEFTIRAMLQHKNVVRLLGYSVDINISFRKFDGRTVAAEDRKCSLVTGYFPKGSLEEIIEGKRCIDWCTCFKIIQEIAQGVHYIHEQRVIHLDLKPLNILFDSDMTPMINDFGLSKVVEHDGDEIVADQVLGTMGYMAPEQYCGRMSLKSDVFAFGIIVRKTIISEDAIKKYDVTGSKSGHYGRDQWERTLQQAGGLKALLNPAIEKVDDSQIPKINRCVEVGLLCTQLDPADRPSMIKVVELLSGEEKLPAPKKQEKLVTPNKEERSVVKKLEKALSKGLGRAVSKT